MAKGKNESKNLDAALETKNEVAVKETTAVATSPVLTGNPLVDQLTALGASAGLVKRVVKASSNFALMETPKIPRIKALSDGLLLDESDPEAQPVKELQGVILFGAKQKAYYENEYDPESKVPPDCYAHGSPTGAPMVPDSGAEHPQAKACKDCKWNKFETAKVGKGKKCRDLRRLFLLISVEPGSESIMPIQLNITPTSLKNFDDYLGKLVMYGMSLDEVVTKITGKKKNRDDKFMVYSFAKVQSFNEDKPEEKQVLNNIQALKTAWMPHMERAEITGEDLAETEAAAPTQAPVAKPGDY
jgi:hypothetical protein